MKAPRFSSLVAAVRSIVFKLIGASPLENTGRGLATVSVSIAAWVGLRGINAPFPDGHFAAQAAVGVFAENMWRWKTIYPVMGYLTRPPSSANLYMHHPLGIFWSVALLGKVFGFHNWVLRLPAIVCATSTPYLLYKIGRELWGSLEGGLAALAFVALPITLGYASFHDLEQPMMLGCVLGTWGYLRFAHTWRFGYAALSIAGFLLAATYDWQGYVWGILLLVGLLFRGYILPERWFGPVPPRPFARYWALFAIAIVSSLALTVYLISDSGRINDLLSIYGVRTSGSGTPLSAVLAARAYRIELMFTGLGIFLGKLAVPVIVARAVLKRSDLELLPIPMLLTALVQYLVFKQGADVHIFWPHPFAMYFGLAIGALAASVRDIAAWLGSRASIRGARWGHRLRRLAPWLALPLVGLPTLLVLRDGLSIVRLSRETGGRFAEANLESFLDADDAISWFLDRQHIPETAVVGFHSSVQATWALRWQVRPRWSVPNQPVAGALAPDLRVIIMDSRTSSVADLRAAAAQFHVNVVGSFWLVDRAEPPASLDGFTFAEHEPTWTERWSLGTTEPVRRVLADRWVTWEWRTLLGQPATIPQDAPQTTDDLRIARNAAARAGDTNRANALEGELAKRFNRRLHARYDNGTELIGAIDSEGAQPNITLFFRAGTFATDAKFSVLAKVRGKPPLLSTLPMDPAELDLALPPRWPTSLWHRGDLYSIRVVYRRRPGGEHLQAGWSISARRAGMLEIAPP